MPHKGLLTAQLGTGGMRLNAGGLFNAVGYQGGASMKSRTLAPALG
jgi:hypothetical protein